MKVLLKYLFLFFVGGISYYLLEIIWRGYSHWSMIIVGGCCFILCGLLNEIFDWSLLMWKQMLICSVSITIIEFISGYILNIILQLNVWDYSTMPFNVMGQICLPFTIAWFFVSAVAIILDDYIRYWLFNEEKPSYRWR